MNEREMIYEAYVTIKRVEEKIGQAIELLDNAFSDLDRVGDALLELAKLKKVNMEGGEEK